MEAQLVLMEVGFWVVDIRFWLPRMAWDRIRLFRYRLLLLMGGLSRPIRLRMQIYSMLCVAEAQVSQLQTP